MASPPVVLFDLSGTTTLSAAALRRLLVDYRSAGRAALVGVGPALRGVLAATGFLGHFTVLEQS
ncbi:hypothetical protein [Saccharothrix obliqua]|uniref:hypothetical protein n=1 Tax=Saccharothrix obliqua TaxID=2861747 RepID=UPI001C5E9F17|nr:hypothetical protein [Saccharothrix obliqua]MBW4717742.1 hypothetical protein [Saccharothrix obliqua]